jgi:hypothetical protein
LSPIQVESPQRKFNAFPNLPATHVGEFVPLSTHVFLFPLLSYAPIPPISSKLQYPTSPFVNSPQAHIAFNNIQVPEIFFSFFPNTAVYPVFVKTTSTPVPLSCTG